MKNFITPATPEFPKKSEKFWVFLAGPIQGAPAWQFSMPDIPGVLWVSPRHEHYPDSVNFDWDRQVKWETEALRMCDMVLFWIPKEIETIPGRHYAQTTRTEIGEILGRRFKKIVVGIEPGALSGTQYFERKLEQYSQTPLRTSLEDCIRDVKVIKNNSERSISEVEYFTSDTHFGQSRTLVLSHRPFKNVEDMNWTLIERWNFKIPPHATVWHLGDFGDPSILKYLNGNIHLVKGNYEVICKEDEVKCFDGFTEVVEDHIYHSYKIPGTDDMRTVQLHHEPLKHFDDGTFSLFGHIHGRQKVKRFGIDVGTDAWNFLPVSTEDIEFLLNALEKGYYDEEVFCV